jgi:hypothetical protein
VKTLVAHTYDIRGRYVVLVTDNLPVGCAFVGTTSDYSMERAVANLRCMVAPRYGLRVIREGDRMRHGGIKEILRTKQFPGIKMGWPTMGRYVGGADP